MHHGIDTIRAQFFCRGASNIFKYHMMEWESVTTPKDYGWLGILNTRIMNVALLCKWIWRIYDSDENDLCCEI